MREIMKPRMVLACAAGTAALVLSGAVMAAEASAPAAAGSAGATKAGAPAKPVLDKGMTAEQVRRAIGAPLAIKPMEAPAGSKAETWIYRRQIGTTMRQAAVTMKTQPMYIGPGFQNTVEDRPVMDYQLEQITTYQVTALLMVDDHLVLARQWKETQRSYQK